MDSAFLSSTQEVLKHFQVAEQDGLSDTQVRLALEKFGHNGTVHLLALRIASTANNAITAIAEDPPTPVWKLILEQFKDQLVIILLGSAAISFVLALFEDGEGWTAFVDPAVVSRWN